MRLGTKGLVDHEACGGKSASRKYCSVRSIMYIRSGTAIQRYILDHVLHVFLRLLCVPADNEGIRESFHDHKCLAIQPKISLYPHRVILDDYQTSPDASKHSPSCHPAVPELARRRFSMGARGGSDIGHDLSPVTDLQGLSNSGRPTSVPTVALCHCVHQTLCCPSVPCELRQPMHTHDIARAVRPVWDQDRSHIHH